MTGGPLVVQFSPCNTYPMCQLQEQSRPVARPGKDSGDGVGGSGDAATSASAQAAGPPQEHGGLPAPPGRRQRVRFMVNVRVKLSSLHLQAHS